MRTFRSILAAVALVATVAAPAGAAEWTIDTSHSSVGFHVRHFFTKVPGSFNKFTGAIQFDPADPGKASVKVEIDATSIDTGNAKRDDHLRSADFFDVAKFPTLTFTSTKVVPKGKDAMTVTGDLTMHGVTKPVDLEVSFLGAMKDPWGNDRSGFEAKGKLDRKEFGIVYNKVLDTGGTMLSDEIDIHINIEAISKKPEAEKPAADKPAAK